MRLRFVGGEVARRRGLQATSALLPLLFISAFFMSESESTARQALPPRTIVERASRSDTFDIEDAKLKLLELQAERRALEKKAEEAHHTLVVAQHPATLPAPPPIDPSSIKDLILECIRSYEGAYTTDTGNGFFWAYQFTPGTWNHAATGSGQGQYVGWAVRGHQPPPPTVQNQAAWWLYTTEGMGHWPTPNRWCHPPSPLKKADNPDFQ